MTRVAYVDMIGGAAGDMLLAALIDVGADADAIEATLRTIEPAGWTLRIERTDRRGIDAIRCCIEAPGEDLPPARGSEHEHRGRLPTHANARKRTLDQVLEMLEHSALTTRQKERARTIFHRLADAEARAYNDGRPLTDFHDVGALDAVLDVAGVCVALDLLNVEELTCSAFPIGRRSAPASALLARGCPVRNVDGGVGGDLVTATAFAILTTLVANPGKRPAIIVERSGYGAGRSHFSFPNVVCISMGERDIAD